MGFISSLPGGIAQGLVWGLLAIGLYISYKVLDIADLTVDGSVCTGAVVCAVLLQAKVNIVVCLIAAFVAGLLCGMITGLFNTLLGIPPILAGILTQLILWSVNLKILGRANLPVNGKKYFILVSSAKIWPSVLILVGFTVCIIALLYWFFGTEYGSAVRATGNNEKMAKANGINTKVVKVFGLALSNGIIALAGALLAQYQGFADINMGRGAIVVGLASVIIGTSITKLISKNFGVTLLGCSLGAIIYFIIYSVVIFLGFDTDLLKMLSAILVAIFLGIPYLSSFAKKGKRKRKLKPSSGNEGGNE